MIIKKGIEIYIFEPPQGAAPIKLVAYLIA